MPLIFWTLIFQLGCLIAVITMGVMTMIECKKTDKLNAETAARNKRLSEKLDALEKKLNKF